jgi:hypothetical protein
MSHTYVEVTYCTNHGRRRKAILRDPVYRDFGSYLEPWQAVSGTLVDDEGVPLDRPTHALISTDLIVDERQMVMDQKYGVLMPVPSEDEVVDAGVQEHSSQPCEEVTEPW